MAGSSTLELFIILLGLSQVIANSEFKNKCEYDLIESFPQHSLNLSVDAELVYRIFGQQNGCVINLDEIYKNITKQVRVNRTEIYVSLGFFCEASQESNIIHFTFSDIGVDFDEISAQIILGICSIYMDELSYFNQYGHIWSVVTTNSSFIHPGTSCSSLKHLRMLSSSLPCTANGETRTKSLSDAFFWELCEPFEQLYNLRLQGCATNQYKMKDAFIQYKFPKLQTLWMKYIDLSLIDLIFPWTNVYIDSSDVDVIRYLSYYEESELYDNSSIARSINIYDSTVSFGSDIIFVGYVNKVTINNVNISKLGTLFTKVRDLEVLDLSNNEIQEVDRRSFLLQTKMTRLNLANNKMKTLPEEVFDSLHNLLYLDLSSNIIFEVKQRHFKYLLKLKELNLEDNNITTLAHDFLEAQINSIQYVFLSQNPLKTLPLNVFYAPNVLLVDISNCHINSSGLLSLLNKINVYEMQTAHSQLQFLQPWHTRTIDLSQNKFTTIPIGIWQTSTVTKFKCLIQSFYINLKDNPLDCTCKIISTSILADVYVNLGLYIDWKCQYPLELQGRLISTIKPEETYCPVDIKYCPDRCHCFERSGTKTFIPDSERLFIIDCRNTNMTSMPLAMPLGLLELRFRNSSISDVPPRDYLKNVTMLDLSHNRINQIVYDTAIALSNVSILKLDHNKLTYLPEQLMRTNMSLVTLSGNLFICDCKMKWMKSWLLARTNPVKDWKDIECTYDASRVQQMISLKDTMFVCKDNTGNFYLHEHVTFPSIIIGSVLFVLVSLSMLVIFYRFTIKVLLFIYCGLRPFDKSGQHYKNTTYDAFVLYSHADRVFTHHNLIERLRDKGFSVIDLYKDLIVGFSFLQNMDIFIKRSKRVIFCWTGDMLENDLILSAWDMAYERAIKRDLNSLILVVDSDVNKKSCRNDNLMSFLKRGKYIKKHSKYMFAGVEYLMTRVKSNMVINITTDDCVEEESDIPMLSVVPNLINDRENDLIYVSYTDDLDMEIRHELIPYLRGKRINIKVLEHDFTFGADIREEIHAKLDNSRHFIFIVSNSFFEDDVKMFILRTVMSKSKIRCKNYLLLFTYGHLHDVHCSNELNSYFNNFVTGSIRDENFRSRLLQAIGGEFD